MIKRKDWALECVGEQSRRHVQKFQEHFSEDRQDALNQMVQRAGQWSATWWWYSFFDKVVQI